MQNVAGMQRKFLPIQQNTCENRQTVRYARRATQPLYSTFLVTISKFSRLIAASRATAVATTTAATPTVGSLSSTLTIRDIYSGRRANTVSTDSSVTAVLTMLVSEK